MKKRIVALLLALVMALGLAMPASATGLEGTTDPTIIGGAGESVVITGDGVTTTPAAPKTGTDADTPAPTDTPTTGDSTTTPPAAGDSTTTVPTPPATPVDGEDEDESDTPMPLLGMTPLSGGTPVVLAATPVSTSYLDVDGETKTASAIPVTASTTTWGAENETTWYVVNGSVTIDETVTVAMGSDVHLILADGAELTVNGKKTTSTGYAIGFKLLGSLTIYAQSNGTGTLTANAENVENDFSLGIEIFDNGGLTVNGGVIDATGGAVSESTFDSSSSYGIGASGDVTINGGTVTATGGSVESGKNNTGSDAASSSHGLLISSTTTVTVNGGKLTATGGNKATKTGYDSAGMCSSGIYCRGTLNVEGGEVEAIGGTAGDASSGIRMDGSNSLVDVDGGKLTATGGSYGISNAAINSGTNPTRVVKLTSGTLIANGSTEAFNYTVGSFTHINTPATYYLRTAVSDEFTKCNAVEGKYSLDQGATYVELTTQPSGNKYIPYKNWDEANKKLVDDAIATTSATEVTNTTTTWGGGTADNPKWYVVNSDVTISSQVTVTGDVHLILKDGAALTVTNTSYNYGLVIGNGASLTIYAQSTGKNAGALTSNTVNRDGIYIEGNSLTINGGNVTGNSTGSHGINAEGALTVNSGNVTAEGKLSGLFIQSSAIVNGGKLIAKCTGTTGMAVHKWGDDSTFTPPSTYWWRTAESGDSAKFKTQDKYADSALGGTYFELTTTQPAASLLDRVDYMNWVDSQLVNAYCESFTPVTTDTTTLGEEGKTTWYVVKDNVTISGKLTAYGDVHLILCDSKMLTVNGGVAVVDTTPPPADKNNSSLTIYGQSGQSGKLVAKDGTESGFSAGIKINGYSSLTINGGVIEATGGNAAEETPVVESYGIYGSYVVINSGKVTARGGTAAPYSGNSNTVSGGISVWELCINGDSKVTATGGTVTGTEGTSYGVQADLKITGGTMIAESASGKAVVFPDDGTITPPDAYWWRTANTAQYYTQKTFDSDKLDTATYFELTTTEQANVASESVKYVGQDGSETSCDDFSVVPNAVDESTGAVIWGSDESGPVWYVVNKNMTINGMVGVMGNVNLILCNGATLTVTGGIGSYSEGSSYIEALSGGSLTIYGQTPETGKTTGKLVVNGFAVDGMSAGIMLGELTINGGEVEATGCDSTENSVLTISAGVLAMKLAVNGGKLTATGGADAHISCGILGIIMSVNGQRLRSTLKGIDNETEAAGDAVVTAAPEIEGVGGNTVGGISVGILSFSMAVDGVNIGEAMSESLDLAEDDPATDSTTGTTGSTCSAKITAKGGAVSATEGGAAVTRDGLDSISASCGLFACLLHVGVSADDIWDIMGGGESDGLSLLGENGDETTAATSAGSTAQINATGDSIGVVTLDLLGAMAGGEEVSMPIPAVWLNGGTLTATGATSGIYKLDLNTFYSLDTFGLLGPDTFGIDTYGGTEDGTETAPAAPMIYVQKGTLIADATGTGLGLALGDPVSATVPLKCPAEYWWRINKAVNGYTKYPTKAYSYTGQHDYVEITTNGEGLLLLPEPGEDVTPQPPADTGTGSAQQPIRRQNGTVAALIPSAGSKTDVESPETFDAGIALYVGLGVLSLTGSAAWVGKRKKW